MIFREAVAILQKTVPGHLDLGHTQTKLGKALLRQQKYPQALEQTLAGYQILNKQTGPKGALTLRARKDLVAEYEGLKQPAEADRYRDAAPAK